MRFRVFLISLVLSLPFWWVINVLEINLEEIFFWQRISQSLQIFAAQINLEENLLTSRPILDKKVESFETTAKSAATVFINEQGKEKILLEKEINQPLPIASLTKLMTALIVLENYDLSKEITISQEAIEQEADLGRLEAGKSFTVEYLLYPLLIESSNDAAFALASDYDGMIEKEFVRLMAERARELGLGNTFFDNPTGLDPEESGTKMNYSTVADLTKLTKELLSYPLVWQILTTEKYNDYGPELTNTNELLAEIPGIVGGKTGYTEKALGCMLLVVRAPKNSGHLIYIILGAEDKFGEMRELIDWAELAYKW